MGIDANIVIKFKNIPREEEIKKLRFHLLHRFSTIISQDGEVLYKREYSIFDEDLDKDGYENHNWVQDERVYDIAMLPRYYSVGYERGPGAKLSSMLIYLCKYPEISDVYYGGDGIYTRVTLDDARSLFEHWIDNGSLPYQLNRMPIGISKNEPPPVCDFCGVNMIQGSWSRSNSTFFCVGCGKSKTISLGG